MTNITEEFMDRSGDSHKAFTLFILRVAIVKTIRIMNALLQLSKQKILYKSNILKIVKFSLFLNLQRRGELFKCHLFSFSWCARKRSLYSYGNPP